LTRCDPESYTNSEGRWHLGALKKIFAIKIDKGDVGGEAAKGGGLASFQCSSDAMLVRPERGVGSLYRPLYAGTIHRRNALLNFKETER
jgi:hypothetical protein